MGVSDLKTSEIEVTVRRIVESDTGRTGQLLNVLNEIQQTYRYLPEPALVEASRILGVPFARTYGISTLFADLSLEPVGRYLLEICDGTACHTQGSQKLINKAEELLGIKAGETTPDGLVTLRQVSCIGACSQAPLLVIDGECSGRFKLQDVSAAVDSLLREGG